MSQETFSYNNPFDIYRRWMNRMFETSCRMARAVSLNVDTARTYTLGLMRYLDDFMIPYYIAQDAFYKTEQRKLLDTPLAESLGDYLELFMFNSQVAQKGLDGSLQAISTFHSKKFGEGISSWLTTMSGETTEASPPFDEFSEDLAELMRQVVFAYPEAIWNIRTQFGFNFNKNDYVKVDETERFYLYQILPWDKKTPLRPSGKPIVIIHPYVLGPNILCFLPAERKSYVHAFANQGVPTYVRVMKNIGITPAVQTMTPEQDALDTQRFCEHVVKKHGRLVTLNGFCQGGFIAALELISGVLDGLVDAFITCVSPMDGTRSVALTEYLRHLPPRFRERCQVLQNQRVGHAGILDVRCIVHDLQVVEIQIHEPVNPLELFRRSTP